MLRLRLVQWKRILFRARRQTFTFRKPDAPRRDISRGNWASRAAARRWPDSEGFLRLALLFLPLNPNFFFLPWLFICFHLLLALGIRLTFYLYAQMLWRYGLVGPTSHPSLFPCPASLTPSLPSNPPFHPPRGSGVGWGGGGLFAVCQPYSLFSHVGN